MADIVTIRDAMLILGDSSRSDLSVTHLIPRMNAMTVGAKQFKVAIIRRPVSKATPPRILVALWLTFFAAVNMVDIQKSNVGSAARFAPSAERFDQLFFSLPNSPLMRLAAIQVPKCALASRLAESRYRSCSAMTAFSIALPSVREIARPSTVVPVSATGQIGMYFKVATTASTLALEHRSWFSTTNAPGVRALDRAEFPTAMPRFECGRTLVAGPNHNTIVLGKCAYFNVHGRIEATYNDTALFDSPTKRVEQTQMFEVQDGK